MYQENPDRTHVPTPAAPSSVRVPKAGRSLRIATALQVMVAAGNGLAYVALSLRVYQETHSTLAVTMVLLAGGVPVVLLAPVSGFLLDRLPMGRVMSAAAFVVAISLVGLAFVHSLAGTVELVLLFGVADSVLQPGLTAAIPQLAGDVTLVRATSRLQGATMGGTAIGPLLAGVVGSIGGTRTALLLDAGVSVVFIFGIASLRLRRTRAQSPPGADDGMAAGVRYLRRDRPMGLLIVVVSTMIAFLGVTMVAELFLAEKVLHGGTTGYALLITAWTGGMTLGTVIAGRLSPRALAPGIVIGLVVLGLGVAAGALSPTMWLAIVAYGIGGIGDGVQMVGARTLLLQRAPEHIAGRACAVFTGLTFGAVSIGTALSAPLVALLGVRGALFAAGVASVAAAALALALGLHRLRGEVPAMLTLDDATTAVVPGRPALI
ncbi:MAG TPA: MFS transporter [Acidimicrobiales bacterium]|jgi:MFS family permease|nr:MFS transporter [Acidimicrobiales bacterium]